jgi:hypothetical protein
MGALFHSDSQEYLPVACLSRNCRADPPLLPQRREFPRRFLMGSSVDRLPSRFPSAPATWSRATAEARAGFASICDIWSFPTVARSNCRSTARSGRARVGGRRAADTPRENNHGPGTAGARRRYLDAAGWRAPQPPTPHPSGERPWPFSAGVFFLGSCAEIALGHGTRGPGSRLPAWRVTLCGLASAPGWRTFSLRDETRRFSSFPFCQARPTTRSSRCTISVRPPKPRMERMSVEERPLIRPASSAS